MTKLDSQTRGSLADQELVKRGLVFHAVIIGGAALSFLGFITRQTRDCDILSPDIPQSVEQAAMALARGLRARGIHLQEKA